MKITDYLQASKQTVISFEIIPPTRGGNVQQLLALIEKLNQYHPPFIDVTSHASEASYEECDGGNIKRRVRRKRPGTLGICALIQHKFNIQAVPHILCRGFTREETEDFLIDLRYLGIQNIFAIQGDDRAYIKPIDTSRTVNEFARDLVTQIGSLNHGQYLDANCNLEPTDFCIGVAGYPEKHYEAPNLLTDVKYTKEKVHAGAGFIVTQMCYDNRHYFKYVDMCHKEGITVPIIPGIKVLNKKSQLRDLPKRFYIDIPEELTEKVFGKSETEFIDIGIEWTLKQAEELIKAKVPAIHFYVMTDSTPIDAVMDQLKDKGLISF